MHSCPSRQIKNVYSRTSNCNTYSELPEFSDVRNKLKTPMSAHHSISPFFICGLHNFGRATWWPQYWPQVWWMVLFRLIWSKVMQFFFCLPRRTAWCHENGADIKICIKGLLHLNYYLLPTALQVLLFLVFHHVGHPCKINSVFGLPEHWLIWLATSRFVVLDWRFHTASCTRQRPRKLAGMARTHMHAQTHRIAASTVGWLTNLSTCWII